MNKRGLFPLVAITALFMLTGGTVAVKAGGKVGGYVVRMAPYGLDAEQYSSPGWGIGVHAVLPFPQVANTVAVTAGFEAINLLTHTETFIDRITSLRIEQKTDQWYSRLFIGGQIGGHGNGFFRPHAGANIALVYYNISTDVVIPDDYNREQEIRQSLRSEGRVAFGYDLTLGLDLNFSNTYALDGGVRYLKTLGVPEQLGDGSVTIYPQYVQIYLGLGVSFDMFSGTGEESDD